MSLNPLSELKRHLEDDETPLPKRMCLAKNIIQSHHFSSAPKERVLSEWLNSLMRKNLVSDDILKDVISWLNLPQDLSGELKSTLVQVVSQTPCAVEYGCIQNILTFVENEKITKHLILHIDNYLKIIVTLLQKLRGNESAESIKMSEILLKNLVKNFKECKKKLEFITKLLDGENLETLFSYLDTPNHDTVISVFQNILFPISKKSYFVHFLQNLIRNDNIHEFLAEKRDSIQTVQKIMSVYFTFPKGRTNKDQKFLSNFTNVFVSCFRSESQLIFAYYIMIANSLNLKQSYLTPAMPLPAIIFDENDEHIKRNLFLNMIEILLEKEVDISVRLTDTFGEKVSKVEIKKNFSSFLQALVVGQLKLEGKLDKTTLLIIKIALKLDPILVEQKITEILPPLMAVKKTNTSIMAIYTEMLNCMIEILFKLSRGSTFLYLILPHLKLCLEARDSEQLELVGKINEAIDYGFNHDKVTNKVIFGSDILPQETIEMYGKLASELMFRQNKELLLSLQKGLEEHCLTILEEGVVKPSVITLLEVLSAILSSFFRHNKMADHTVPTQIAEDFWSSYQTFEEKCLRKFGECFIKLSYNERLTLSFLQLCLNFAQLKLMNMKYSNVKVVLSEETTTSEIFDLSFILPCLRKEQWTTLLGRVLGDDCASVMNNLLLLKTVAMNLVSSNNSHSHYDNHIQSTKTYLIKQLRRTEEIFQSNTYFSDALFGNLDINQVKLLSKTIVKQFLTVSQIQIFNSDAVRNNRPLLNSVVKETVKNIIKCFDNTDDLSKELSRTDFDIISFFLRVDAKQYFSNVLLKEEHEEILQKSLELLKQIPVWNLEESYQLTTLFVLLIIKKCRRTKKIWRCIDHMLQSLFEMSPKQPDLYKIFPVEFIFSFEDDSLIKMLTLKIKTSNNLFVVKSVLESAVKKVKTKNEIVKSLVEILLTKQAEKKNDVSSTEYFSDPVFQISCIVLPIIAKEKRAITTSAYRSILATLQDKLHASMVECFKSIDFSGEVSLLSDSAGKIDDSMVVSDNTTATLNAIGAYSLTLSKCCEMTNAEEIKKLHCLWSGLNFFVHHAIQAIQNSFSKPQDVESSVQLLNVSLRHIKKLDTHPLFEDKDKIFTQIWKAVVARSLIVFETDSSKKGTTDFVEDMSVTVKFISELVSVECFVKIFVADLHNLVELKLETNEPQSILTRHRVSKYLLMQCNKSNIAGSKCVALSKLTHRYCKASCFWIQQKYDSKYDGQEVKNSMKIDVLPKNESDDISVGNDVMHEILKVQLETMSEIILAGKKISLDYKFIDSIFEHQHFVYYILGHGDHVQCQITWMSFLKLFQGCIAVLNSLLVARAELLEDRWASYMQCYRVLASRLCSRASFSTSESAPEPYKDNLVLAAHSLKKLTVSICKYRSHASRTAAYTVAELSSCLEASSPSREVRQHLEGVVCLLLQICDSNYSAAFLRRALADRPGHVTVTNLYTSYKRYHKYVGNA